MSKSLKIKVRPIGLSIHRSDDEENIPYVRDYYLKDFKYISPEGVGVIKNGARNCNKRNRNRKGTCKLFAKLWLREVMKGLKQFLYEGTLHGVKYIFEPSFSRRERITWIIIMMISVIYCAMNILQLLTIRSLSPFVNVIDSLPTPLWAIPFPTVIICPNLHVKRSFAHVTELDNLERFFAELVCTEMQGEKIRLDRRMTVEEVRMMEEFIVKASPSCNEIIRACKWRHFYGREWNTDSCCKRLFKPVFTEYGLCLSFNGLPLNGFNNVTLAWHKTFDSQAEWQEIKWSVDTGYVNNFPPDRNVLPWRIRNSGERRGLSLELFLNSSEHQPACDGENIGFTVLLKPSIDNVYASTVVRLPMNKLTSIEIDPITYRTESTLRNMQVDQRQCFFQDEKKLDNFLFYTGPNCQQELLYQRTIETCDCLHYNWPRINMSYPICSTKDDYNCTSEVKEDLLDQLMYAYYIDSHEENREKYKSTIRFSCFPCCNSIHYKSHVLYSNRVQIKANNTFRPKSKKEVTQLNVHFQKDTFLGEHKHAQYDGYYFAGAIGGVLSLYLGFSNISIAEMIYFVILKPLHIAYLKLYSQN